MFFALNSSSEFGLFDRPKKHFNENLFSSLNLDFQLDVFDLLQR